MKLEKLHDPDIGELKAIGFMSGSGTNLRKILEHECNLREKEGKSPYRIVAIFSDNFLSSANEIGRDYNIPVILRDINSYYKAHGLPKKDMLLRSKFDMETVKCLIPFEAKCAIYAGYMSVASEILVKAFLGVNVHPADLSFTFSGKRRWVGDHAVRDAILAGEKAIKSSTHIVEPVVDGGRILMISPPLNIVIPPDMDLSNPDNVKEIEKINQNRLKEKGDWIVLPKTIEYIARGFYSTDETGLLYFKDKPVPEGLKL